MTTNYTNDQFYNWNRYETNLNPNIRTSTDNPAFLWPASSQTNSIDEANKIPVRRGYMRMLSEALGRSGTSDKLKGLGANRLFFQFNPDTITRSVTARNDIQYWMNMDPIQLTQPIPGDQNFAFELLFNREAEVASGKVSGFNPGRRVTEELPVPENPAMVGVLADLYKFDQIIGQGLNKMSIDAFVANATAVQAKLVEESKKKKSNGNSDEGDVTKDDQDFENAIEPLSDNDRKVIRENLMLNVGNSAFLVANPIRIVFSSLFMVEGYVTSASVVFNKFNPRMVPTQCVVTVSMQAVYLGFAKKDTFLTYNAAKVENILNQEGYGQNADSSEKTAAQVFIQSIADTGFKRRLDTSQSLIRGAYDLLDANGKRNLFIRMAASDILRTAIKDGQLSNITATATWSVVYTGNTNSIPTNSYEKGKRWVSIQNLDLDLSDLNKTYEFKFDRPSLDEGYLFDTTDTSQYATTINITFTYISGNGIVVESKQALNWLSKTKYKQDSGKATQFGYYYTLSTTVTPVIEPSNVR